MIEQGRTKETMPHNKLILAFVGMSGAGKTEAVAYLEKKGIPFVRFGDITDEGVQELGLPLTPRNERMFREKMRREFGMGAYAIKAKPKVDSLLEEYNVVAIDGLYSWEEYVFLKKIFSGLVLCHVFTEPQRRYERLAHRPVRPLTPTESRDRDMAEIEQLDKGGPIAIADYLIENNGDNLTDLYQKINSLLSRLGIIFSND